MKIIVPVKPVADPNTTPSAWISARQGRSEGVSFVANYFDLIAVEQAIRLKDQGFDDICVVMVAAEAMLPQLRSAIAMGANRAALIDPEGYNPDWYQIAAALKWVVDRERPDLVLMGKQATDDDASQVGPMLAALLGWSQATFVSEMTFNAERTWVRAGRETDEGREVVEVRLPAVVTCDLRLNEPRYATLPNLMKSKKAPLERHRLADLGLDAGVKVTVEGYGLPPGRGGQVRLVADPAELVAVLKERKLVG